MISFLALVVRLEPFLLAKMRFAFVSWVKSWVILFLIFSIMLIISYLQNS